MHELAHIRRYDHLVNLAQGLIEAILFFHPAVWFVSRRIRIERENCCDDMVVAVGGKPVVYASSLVEAAALSRSTHLRGFATATLSASGQPSQLRFRVLRLLGLPIHEPVRLRRGWSIALATAAVVALGAAACLQSEEKITKTVTTGAGTEPYSIEGKFDLNKDIPVGLKVGKRVIGNAEYFAVEVESVRFVKSDSQVEASLRIKTTTILDAKWRARVKLLTADGRVLAHSEAVLATTLRILGRPGLAGGYLHFSLGRWSEVSEGTKFRISIQRAPDDAKVTTHLAREG